MSELVVLNGSGKIARSVISGLLTRTGSKYSSIKLVDARPFRQSVYQWQKGLQGIALNKTLARSAQSLDLAIEGAQDMVYFTHDYFALSTDKNNHLKAAANLANKHGVKNFVAVTPFELDLAWSEGTKNHHAKALEAQQAAIQANSKMTLLNSNLVFGAESHFIHFLAQCALVGKCPYKNLVSQHSTFKYAPIHSDDVASAVGGALEGAHHGIFSLSGSEQHSLTGIVNVLEKAAGKGAGSTGGPAIPPLDLWWDFWTGITSDVNMSRMVEFHHQNTHLQGDLNASSWHEATGSAPQVSFSNFYGEHKITESAYAHPTFAAYKCAHTD